MRGAELNSPETPSSSESLVAEIVDITKICAGQVPATPNALWKELAIWRNLQPTDSMPANARLVIEGFGEEWDEDFLENDGETPTISAIELVHAAIREAQNQGVSDGPSSTDGEEDDEDDGIEVGPDRFSSAKSEPSIKTVVASITEGQWVLDPAWQRAFVWKRRKQQALIESLLLDLPIPSFLLYKDPKTSRRFVIDGRQRLETIYRFTHPKEERGAKKVRFRTFRSTQEGWKVGQPLGDAANKFYQDLPEKYRIDFDNRSITVFTLSNVSLSQLYQIFKRYNTGSVSLNAAEIRNAVYQSSPLHQMLFRLAGEHRDVKKYVSAAELQVGEDLRSIMQRKSERYGAYDFIGRFFAFRYGTKGSVAKATNDFMADERNNTAARVEALRMEFINAFTAVSRWYDPPLTAPTDGGQFHAFLATIQLVSASRLLRAVSDGSLDESQVRPNLTVRWPPFAKGVLELKQNSTNFWGKQREWIQQLEDQLGLAAV